MEDRGNSTENQQMESSQRRENTLEAKKMGVRNITICPEVSYLGVVLIVCCVVFQGLIER